MGTKKIDFPGKAFHAKAIWLNNTDYATTCKPIVLCALRARFSVLQGGSPKKRLMQAKLSQIRKISDSTDKLLVVLATKASSISK